MACCAARDSSASWANSRSRSSLGGYRSRKYDLGVADRRTLLHEAEREERLEEAQLVLVDAHRVEGADVERAHFHVLHPGAAQRLGGALAGASHTLRPDEAVVLVLDLQDVGVELPVFAVHLHAERLV